MEPSARGGNSGGERHVAKRRREQYARAQARHVQWLVGLLQHSNSHHTGRRAGTEAQRESMRQHAEQRAGVEAQLKEDRASKPLLQAECDAISEEKHRKTEDTQVELEQASKKTENLRQVEQSQNDEESMRRQTEQRAGMQAQRESRRQHAVQAEGNSNSEEMHTNDEAMKVELEHADENEDSDSGDNDEEDSDDNDEEGSEEDSEDDSEENTSDGKKVIESLQQHKAVDWMSELVPLTIRRPWQVFEEDLREKLEDAECHGKRLNRATRMNLTTVQGRGARVAFGSLAEKLQRFYVEVSIKELAAYVSWQGRVGCSLGLAAEWDALECDDKCEWVHENPRAVLAADPTWTPLLARRHVPA